MDMLILTLSPKRILMLIFWENSPKRKISHRLFHRVGTTIGQRELRQHLKTSGVNIISIPNKEIEGILAYHNATANMVLSGQAQQTTKEN
ncbi:MAG: hypothetical protein ACLSHC_05355 [Bilophila wadsworthia]